jgi:N-methylhydantoinase A
MRRAIIPAYPGVLSACGLVEADLEYQHGQTILTKLDEVDEEDLREHFALLERRGLDDMSGAGMALDDLVFERFVNVRYRRQVRQMTVELGREPVSADWIRRRFLEEHERQFGYLTDEPIEVVDVRVACVHRTNEEITWSQPADVDAGQSVAFRRAFFEERNDFVDCPVYPRAAIKPGVSVQGPAIVQQKETNTVVRPGQTLEGHESGSMIILPEPTGSLEGLTSRNDTVRAGETQVLR